MNFDWTNMLYSLPGVIIGLTVHEFSHAFVADKLGDGTGARPANIKSVLPYRPGRDDFYLNCRIRLGKTGTI